MKTVSEIAKDVIESIPMARNMFGDNVTAEYSPFQDLKVRWTRSSGWINFQVTDYLKDAPGDVTTGLFKTLVLKIIGEDPDYPQEVIDYLTNPEFISVNRPIYISRQPDFIESNRLTWSLKRLKKKGLIDGQDIKIGFGTIENKAKSSTLFKTAVINSKLMDADKDVLDYVVFTQAKYIEMVEFGDDPENIRAIVDSIEMDFENWEELSSKALKLIH